MLILLLSNLLQALSSGIRTSSKSVGREGLGESRTGTRQEQITTNIPGLCLAMPFPLKNSGTKAEPQYRFRGFLYSRNKKDHSVEKVRKLR